MILKDYLRKLKKIIEKESYGSDNWKLYEDLYKLQALEIKYNIRLEVKPCKKVK